ncbi:Crp/Fnr family transcriptional regulator [Flavobacterium hungaricum]|uniref:Crp/Fnr family transcriptional regulator n=1 Tax=Flavobacterium hungaricum TaxID=2082725 RepID=A0ABR9TQS6_9FLAO|nr:Crp/Fnr family transcriptional regulator [Flavobacterium hungaricum]MBE8727626.1 Crp/Fnr family transcriptional regulator [Flavobacterium hungaricum]
MRTLLNVIEGFQELDNETRELIKFYFVEEKFGKEEILLNHGTICDKIYFIKSGLLRRVCVENGEEIIKWIYTNNQFCTSLSSYFEQKPSSEIIVASDVTIVYSLSYKDELKLLDQPLFAKFHIKLLRLYLSKLNEFHHIFTHMTAQEKYVFLLQSFPEIVKKAKLKHIASFIGVSQETLSRIRASII